MAGEDQSISALEICVDKLLQSGDYEFDIPKYQRPYAWDVVQSLDLLSDLQGALERDTDEPYFLGSIVLVRADNKQSHSEVIDGQQRLTTLTLLLALLRDLSTDPYLKDSIHQLIEKPEVKWNNEPAKPRLKLRPLDNEFFHDNVQTMGSTLQLLNLGDKELKTDAQRKIRNNAIALHQELVNLDMEGIKDLFRLISRRVSLVVVGTSNLNSAYRIFSVMNSRGLPLLPQDIFKSGVIAAIDEEEQQKFTDIWEQIEMDLGRNEFKDLFPYIRTIKSRSRGEKSLLHDFQKQVLNQYMPNNGAAFIQEVLVPYADSLALLIEEDSRKDKPDWKRINRYIHFLNRLDNNDWRPPALWALTNKREDVKFLETFFEKLERLAASMLLRRANTARRQTRYAELLKQLTDGQGVDSPSFDLSDLEKSETREKLRGDMYESAYDQYVLLRLDSILSPDPNDIRELLKFSVDRVLPQNPHEHSRWRKDFTVDEIAYWTNKLCNLVLLNRNRSSDARNLDYETKKQKYFVPHKDQPMYTLTELAIREPKWKPDMLEKRQRDLLNALFVEWKL